MHVLDSTRNRSEPWMRTRLLCVLYLSAMFICGCRKQSVATSSMWPTIKPGESVTVDYSAYLVAKPKRWDVVVFRGPTPLLRTNHSAWAKRVIALPTETISLTTTGILVNGTPLPMPLFLSNVVYCPPERTPQKQDLMTFPYTIPPRHYFVVGDNWGNSMDSRYYGAVCITDIFGRVMNK